MSLIQVHPFVRRVNLRVNRFLPNALMFSCVVGWLMGQRFDAGRSDVTQGAVFACARSVRYSEAGTHGIIVSARCDIEHGKLDSLTYLPVVPFRQWLQLDYWELLAARVVKDRWGRLRGLLRDAGFSDSVIQGRPLRRVHDVLLVGDESKAGRRRATQFLESVEVLEFVDSIESANLEDVRRLAAHSNKAARRIIAELLEHKLPGFYYLPTLHGDHQHWVVGLREVRDLPMAIAERVGVGLERAEYEHLRVRTPSLGDPLVFDEVHDFSCVTGVLRSPDVEHLVQMFASQFTRIGLEDHEPVLASNLASHLES